MDDENPVRRDSGIGLGGLIILALISWFIYGHFHKDYSKPWFSGNQAVRLCKEPYYTNDSCYRVTANSDGSEINSILFPNNGYISVAFDSCDKAASIESVDRFCEVEDPQNGDTYQVLPLNDRY